MEPPALHHLSVCTGPGALSLWGLISICEQMRKSHASERCPHLRLSELGTSSPRSGTHIMVTWYTVSTTIFQQMPDMSPGEGVPFVNLHKGSVWMSRGESEAEEHT